MRAFLLAFACLSSACATNLDRELRDLTAQREVLETEASQVDTSVARTVPVDGALWLSSAAIDGIIERVNSIPSQQRNFTFQQTDQGGHILRRTVRCSLNRTRHVYIETRPSNPLRMQVVLGKIQTSWDDSDGYSVNVPINASAGTKIFFNVIFNRQTLCASESYDADADFRGSDVLTFRIVEKEGRLLAQLVSPDEFALSGEIRIPRLGYRKDVDLELLEAGVLSELFSVDNTDVLSGEREIVLDGQSFGVLEVELSAYDLSVLERGWDLTFEIDTKLLQSD